MINNEVIAAIKAEGAKVTVVYFYSKYSMKNSSVKPNSELVYEGHITEEIKLLANTQPLPGHKFAKIWLQQ